MVSDSSVVAAVDRDYRLQALNFSVAPGLTVSEANNFYPIADIVWRGDPAGDRGAQIAALFQEAATRVQGAMTGQQGVVADVVLRRFHGLTERTRYSIGGIYDVEFDLTIRDVATGAVIEPSRNVILQLQGPGGEIALELEREGLTERVRIVNFLTEELTRLLS
jgi:hypothetical protein